MSQQLLTWSPQSLTVLSVGQNRPNFSLAGSGPQAPQVISCRSRHRIVHVVDYGNARLTNVTTDIIDLLVSYLIFFTSYPTATLLLPFLFTNFPEGSLAPLVTMRPSRPLSAELQSSDNERLGLAAHMSCASSLASSSCSAVPSSPHFGSVDTLRTADGRASAVAVGVSSALTPPTLLDSKPLPMADLLAPSVVLPALACIAGDYRARYQSGIASAKRIIERRWLLVTHYQKLLDAADSTLVMTSTPPATEVERDRVAA